MSQYVIKLSTLANIYSEFKSLIDSKAITDDGILSRLAQLESEFSSTRIDATNKLHRKIISFKYAIYGQTSISVTNFLDCYYAAYKAKSKLIEDFLFSNDSELDISYQGLCSIYGESLVDSIIKNAINQGNGKILVG